MTTPRRNLSAEASNLLLAKFSDTSIQPLGQTVIDHFIKQYKKLYKYPITVISREPKSIDRCISKIWGYIDQGIAKNEIDAINNHLKDLAGARLVFLFPGDIKVSVDRFRSFVEETTSSAELPNMEINGESEEKEYDTGYRAIHQRIRIQNMHNEWGHFEIQFMNALQHVWDKVQGPLYREPTRYPTSLHTKMRKLSLQCEYMCTKFEEVLIEIEKHDKRAH